MPHYRIATHYPSQQHTNPFLNPPATRLQSNSNPDALLLTNLDASFPINAACIVDARLTCGSFCQVYDVLFDHAVPTVYARVQAGRERLSYRVVHCRLV